MYKNSKMTFPQQLEEPKISTRDQLSGVLALRKVWPLIGSPIGDLLRGVVTRVVDKKLEDFYARMRCTTCQKLLINSEPRTLELKFLDKIQTPVYTGRKIEGEGSTSIKLALVDCLTGAVVKSGCEATASIELAVVKGDSNGDGGDNLTAENFDSKIAETRIRGKKSLLKGHHRLSLTGGICDLGEISFIHNSGWMKISKLCLAARVLDSFSGTTIKPTKTEYFMLKDCRNTLYGKKYPPALCDAVWRLKNIGKKFRNRLNREKIESVEDFLKLLYMEPERLQKILRAGPKTWEVIIEHAKTCMIDENEQYAYHGVVFNVVGQLKGILKGSEYVPVDKLSENEKENAKKLVIRAFRDGEELTPYINDTSLMEACPPFPESTGVVSPNDCNNAPMMTINTYNCTEVGTSTHVTVSSINCIGESSHSDDGMDLIKELLMQDFDHPINSPETAYHSFDQQFLSNNYPSVAQTDQTPPGILLVDSHDVPTNDNMKRWRRLLVVLNAIVTVKSKGDPERVRALKKQRVS